MHTPVFFQAKSDQNSGLTAKNYC